MDTGREAIEDEAELAQVRRQARKVQLQSLAMAIVVTGLVMAIPIGW
jgi:hypothetical protein